MGRERENCDHCGWGDGRHARDCPVPTTPSATELFGPKPDPGYVRAVQRQNEKPPVPPFVDGSGVTPGTEGCKCDGPCPHCTDGCEACEGTGRRLCEFPCWQRLGMTSEPCCSDCAPLDEAEPEQRTTVTALSPESSPGTGERDA